MSGFVNQNPHHGLLKSTSANALPESNDIKSESKTPVMELSSILQDFHENHAELKAPEIRNKKLVLLSQASESVAREGMLTQELRHNVEAVFALIHPYSDATLSSLEIFVEIPPEANFAKLMWFSGFIKIASDEQISTLIKTHHISDCIFKTDVSGGEDEFINKIRMEILSKLGEKHPNVLHEILQDLIENDTVAFLHFFNNQSLETRDAVIKFMDKELLCLLFSNDDFLIKEARSSFLESYFIPNNFSPCLNTLINHFAKKEDFSKQASANANETFVREYIELVQRYPALKLCWSAEDEQVRIAVAKALLQIRYPEANGKDLNETAQSLSYYLKDEIHDPSHLTGVLLKLAPYILGKESFLEYLSKKSEWVNKDLNQMGQFALKYQTPITPKVLRWAVLMQNKELLQYLLASQNLPKLDDKDKRELITRLGESQNPFLFEFFFHSGLIDVRDVFDRSEEQPIMPISEMIQKRQTFALQKLFELGLKFSSYEMGLDMMNMALQEHQLDQVVLFYHEIVKQFPENELVFPNVFSEETDKDPIKDQLLRFALNSSLPALYAVINDYYKDKPEMQNRLVTALESIMPTLAIQARLPKFQISDSLSELKAVQNFAFNNSNILAALTENLKTFSWPNFLKDCIARRKEVLEESPDIKNFRVKNQISHTPIGWFADNPEFPVSSRYSYAWHKSAVIRENVQDPSDLIEKGPHEKVSFFYKLPNGQRVCMNQIHTKRGTLMMSKPSTLWGWMHAVPASIVQTNERTNQLHREVVEFDWETKSREDFDQLVAEAYWLMTTRAETMRGAAHNAKLWLLAVHQYHKLPLPIVKMEYFYLDTMMMCLTVNQAKELWPTFFEPLKSVVNSNE